MLGVAIWGIWKINSRRQIGEEDQNSKYHWTGGEFTIFFLPVCPSLNLMWSWNLEVSIINTDRKSTRRSPLVLTQGAGRDLLMFRENVAIPHPSLFSSFFSFSSFSCTPGLKQSVLGRSCSGLNGGRQEPKSQREGNLPARLEELWCQESAANPVVFFSLYSSVAWPWCGHSHGKYMAEWG